MLKPKNLYVDSDGVKRGYYVYFHKDCVNDEVFYVGKGYGRRAWDSNRRNHEWVKKVELLPEGWEVEIVQDDLSEIEAFDLEAEMVEKYGGAATTGGTLTNLIPGGEHPVSVSIEMGFTDLQEWFDTYCEFRNFKTFPRKKQEEIATRVTNKLKPIMDRLFDLLEEGDQNENDKLSDSASNVECIIGSLTDISKEFVRRRVPWKDFGITLEETLDDLKFEMEDLSEHHRKVIPLMKKAIDALQEFFSMIDSGNREEAEQSADITKGQNKNKRI